MSYITELSNRCCFTWKGERPVTQRPRYSPEFYIGSDQYQLEFKLTEWKRIYSLHLNSTKCTAIGPFSITVHVENSNRSSLPLSNFIFCQSKSPVTIWSYGESDIIKAMPDFFKVGIVNFLVTIDNEPQRYQVTLGPPIEKFKVDKSILTPSFMSVDPCLESLSADLSKLLEQDSRPDVTLICGDLNLKAHRSVLSCRSGVFSSMLSNDMTEGRTGQVQIPDMDSGAFEAFVRYLYTGKLPELTEDSARCLYEAADKYGVVGLQKRCASFFLEILSCENACDMLALADAHSDQDFKERVMEYILQKEIPLIKNLWLPFMGRYPNMAAAILYRFYELQKVGNKE